MELSRYVACVNSTSSVAPVSPDIFLAICLHLADTRRVMSVPLHSSEMTRSFTAVRHPVSDRGLLPRRGVSDRAKLQ
jgi:hypothetical protein